MKIFTKKRAVLLGLFILPLVFFLFLSTGVNNFNKLPVLTENISTSNSKLDSLFSKKVSVLIFVGENPDKVKSGLLNVNEKIYKNFIKHPFFQAVVVFPKESSEEVNEVQKKLEAFTNMDKWSFVAMENQEIETLFSSLKTDEIFNDNLYSKKVFIIDREVSLRGRTEDEDEENSIMYGYNMESVSELNSKLKDDLNVLLYEYGAAFKDKRKANRINN